MSRSSIIRAGGCRLACRSYNLLLAEVWLKLETRQLVGFASREHQTAANWLHRRVKRLYTVANTWGLRLGLKDVITIMIDSAQ